MDDVKSQMEGVSRTYTELANKMADKCGVQNLFGMNHKIRQALGIISIGEGATQGNPHPCPKAGEGGPERSRRSDLAYLQLVFSNSIREHITLAGAAASAAAG